MRAHGLVLRAVARRIGVFTLLLLGIPLTVRLYGLHAPNPIASMVTLAIGLPTILWFAGGLLGSAASSLLNGTRSTLVPGYRRKVLTVIVLTGLGLWSLVPLYYAAGGFAVDQIAWLRWVPLWSYGLLGLGFIGGIFATDLGCASSAWSWSRQSVTRTVPLMLLWMLPFIVAANQPLRQWLTAPRDRELPGVSVLAMACLLLGPLSWFAIARLAARLQSPATAVKRSLAEQMRSGANNAWGLPAIAARLHGKGRTRIEFLVFQPTLLAMGIAPLIVAVCALAFQVLMAGVTQTGFVFTEFLKANLNAMLIFFFIIPLGPIYSGAIDLPRLGQGLLLPGQFRRSSLPRQLFRRLLAVWIGGALLALLPAVAIVLWLGTSVASLGWIAVLLIWGIVLAASVEFFRAPRAPRKAVNDPVRIALSMGLLLVVGLAKPLFFDVYTAWVCLLVMALAFVIPGVLYRKGLKRWHTMEYGA